MRSAGGDLEHEDGALQNESHVDCPKPFTTAQPEPEQAIGVEANGDERQFSCDRTCAMTKIFWVLALRNSGTFGQAFLLPCILLIIMAFIPDPNSQPTVNEPTTTQFSLDRLGGTAPQTLYICLGAAASATFSSLQTFLQQQSGLIVECWDGTSNTDCRPTGGCDASISAGFLDGSSTGTLRRQQ